ncbi:disease resistance protein At4g27190-like [Rhododendron vialii]|uniref:disease resistance protein At4g27190-like n=1 Tax=Rhododendron vialii TaxID=182163 RepID=UPI00265EA00B|nr:disease resistance protein At4g27190-like [Rhododendron vialii]
MCTPHSIIEQLGCRAFDEAVNAASKAGKYVLQYRTNLDKLRTEMRSLEDRRVTIERKVREANDRGEEIENAVSHWQTDADEMKNYVQDLIERSTAEAKMHCFACSCPNIKGRYRLSKQAEEKTADVKKLAQESHFDEISHPKPPPPELEFPSTDNYVHLASRTPILEAIVGVLKDPEVKMIGVYGLGGVGKTTLVEKVAKKMLDDGTFKQVPLVAVSKDLNVKDIQKKLADKLNFTLDAAKDEKGRAIELWNKFKNGEKYLVILDDIWEKVDLKAIGIPVMEGNIGCKVVLTSRNEDLLSIKMKADRKFPIAELLEAEAWELFKKNVGNTIESRPEIDSLARQVCRKCQGLPVAINVVGAALEDKPVFVWKNALEKLDRYMITNIEGIDQTVWASLKLSYDMLGSSDAKSCFLLCCLFLEDAEISIDDLTRHCVANSLLSQNPHTLDEARNAVRTVVDALKSASLLSTDYHENVVKIHDVIRDVGISIAREEKSFLIDHGAHEWPRNSRNVTSYSAISLSFKSIKGLPNGLEYPQLHTLMVDNREFSDLEVPDNFFNGMIQLTVVTITRMRMRRLPSSLAKLANLRMLYLNECELDDIAILKELKSSLEVLSFRGSNIEALPLEIGQLTGLRVLDLQNCDKLKMIPGGVISNLTSLEELYFPQNFDKWEATTDKQQDTSSRENVSLEELRRSLSIGKLTTLHIFIPDVMLLPKEDLIFGNLKGFKISVGNKFKPWEKFPRRCTLKLERIDQLRNEFISLVDKAEHVILSEIEGLKKVFHDRGVENRFLDLKYLEVTLCFEDLEYLFGESKSSMQSHGLHHLQPFNNLTTLIIKNCKSKYLFSPTTAKGLVHLEVLEVRSCKIMEGIVGFERRNDEDELTSEVKFSKLEHLQLEDLPNLLSFYAQKEKMETITGSTSSCAQPLLGEKVIFPVLEKLSIRKVHKIIEIWDKQSIAVLEEQGSFCQLTDLDISECEKLMHVFSSKMHSPLKKLKELSVSDCPTMEGIVEFEGEIGEDGLRNEVCFSELNSLELSSLPNLGSFCTKLGKAGTIEGNSTIHALPLFNGKVIFPVLKKLSIQKAHKIIEIWDKQSIAVLEERGSFCQLTDLDISKCEKLMHVFSSKMHSPLKNLKELSVSDCPTMEGIVEFEGEIGEDGLRNEVCFSELNSLELSSLPNLEIFCTKLGKAGTIEGNSTIHALPLFNRKVIFPVLKKLSIQKAHKIIEIWDKQSIAVLEEQGSFCQLTDLDISECEKLMHVFSSKMHSPLKNLKELSVSDCPTMEGIVEFEGEIGEDGLRNEVCFSELNSLELSSLPNLESFCTKLGKAGTIEGNSTIHALPLFNGKVIFPVLKKLSIQKAHKIIEIWDKQSIAILEERGSFCQLTDLDISECEKLMHVFSSKMHSPLKNLKELSVSDCPTMEGIVEFEGERGEDGLRNEVCFSELNSLELSSLPNLESFCTKLGKAGTIEGNSTIHALPSFNGKVAFLFMEVLNFTDLFEIEKILDDQPLAEQEKEVKSFCQLMKIDVGGCNQLECLLPSYMLPQFKNLQQLWIWECRKMEVIISNNPKEKEATNNNDTIRFPQLKNVLLHELPNLKSFICSDETQLFFSDKDAFPVLEEIDLDEDSEDAFPVLEEIDLDEDSEILRDGTYTKEVSIEKCSTSGKKNDHNGEELDEDIETPPKEVSMEACSTRGKDSNHNGEELDETPTKEECGTSGKQNDYNGEQG